MSKFATPIDVKAELSANGSISKLMPEYNDIPAEFRSWNNATPFNTWQSKWFYEGLKPEDMLKAKPGIDPDAAMRHLAAIQRSWEPKHEHKMAAVAYLASLWFEAP